MGDSELGDLGSAILDGAEEALAEGGAQTDEPSSGGTWLDAPDSSGGVLGEIGQSLRDVLDYQHDVEDEPPPRTGQYPAGGPS